MSGFMGIVFGLLRRWLRLFGSGIVGSVEVRGMERIGSEVGFRGRRRSRNGRSGYGEY